eukprot:1567905-Pyramimonas_sp.AAC.1
MTIISRRLQRWQREGPPEGPKKVVHKHQHRVGYQLTFLRVRTSIHALASPHLHRRLLGLCSTGTAQHGPCSTAQRDRPP